MRPPARAQQQQQQQQQLGAAAVAHWTEEQRARVSSRSYHGARGYTVWVSALLPGELADLRAFATVLPITSKSARGAAAPPVQLLEESSTKVFLPQALALAAFGPPAKPIDARRFDAPRLDADPMHFALPLRPHQGKIIDACMRSMHEQYLRNSYAGIIIQAGCGDGKTIMGLMLAAAAVPAVVSACRKRKREQEADTDADADADAALSGEAALAAQSSLPAPGAVIILVNKGYLANQWVTRIRLAVPGARVGRIQGNVHDVAGCNFVLGMIQTIWGRSYAPDAFAGFQTTIIDEAHNICSLKYFRALRQIVTPFMVALSATVQKPNGMEEILYRYVGPIVYRSPVAPTAYRVTVQIIKYAQHQDPEYSRVDYTAAGELDYSTTLSRVVMYAPRLDAFARVLLQKAEHLPGTQILVLCTMRAPLKEMERRLRAAGGRRVVAPDDDAKKKKKKTAAAATKKRKRGQEEEEEAANEAAAGAAGAEEEGWRPLYGYYVGGMKQEDLDATADGAQIILATYTMASEALDIPSLDCVFMLNGKATITQSIGRMMRFMHNSKYIVDCCDAHGIFQSQLRCKRMPVYRENGYHVYQTDTATLDATGYANAPWKPVYLPPGARAASASASASSAPTTSASTAKCGGEEEEEEEEEAAACGFISEEEEEEDDVDVEDEEEPEEDDARQKKRKLN